MNKSPLLVSCFVIGIFFSCKDENPKNKEGISLEQQEAENDIDSGSQLNSNKKLYFNPGSIILTGHKNIRLIPIQKAQSENKIKTREISYSSYGYEYNYEYEREIEGGYHFYYPGIDIIFGYNLINISHYDIIKDSLSNLFEKPVLIRAIYYPALNQDSLYNKPITRDYFLCSVYNEDTNKDSIINKKDLRRFFYFSLDNKKKQLLIPENYSVLRANYDAPNDHLYIYAILDNNNNGIIEKTEDMHIYMIPLFDPTKSKRIF